MNRVIDTFLFGGELDMLEIRLKYLGAVVDNFIIVESDHTFSGKPKPYYLNENWDRYKEWHDRTLYLQIEQDPKEYVFKDIDRYTPTDGAFKMETDCRNALMHANNVIPDDSIVFLSDVDEVWNKWVLFNNPSLKHGVQYTTGGGLAVMYPTALYMDFYAYYLNNKTITGPDVNWRGTVMCSGRDWKRHTPQWLRDQRNTLQDKLYAGGYHFSWMNGLDAIKNKIQSFAHTEFNRPHILDDQAILSAIEEGRDVLQRPGISYQLQSTAIFPEDLRKILEQYPHLIK